MIEPSVFVLVEAVMPDPCVRTGLAVTEARMCIKYRIMFEKLTLKLGDKATEKI